MPRGAVEPTPAGAAPASTLHDDIVRHLQHLQVERRLAERTLELYREALTRLQGYAEAQPVDLRAVQVFHVRRWAAMLHAGGLAP
ncbi:MAG: site-specific integrase, partial [Rhizobacter sp.]